MGRLWLGIGLIVTGSVLRSPPILFLGLVLAAADGIRAVWIRRGVGFIEYRRVLLRARAVVGDTIPLDITVRNRSPLPLAWLRAQDEASAGVVVRGRTLVGNALVNAWSLAPFERVTRHFHLVADRRGVYALGPVRLETADPFAQPAASAEVPGLDRWLVRPRTVAVELPEPHDQWGGEMRARRGLIDDPTRYAGTRPYQPGDPVRRIHWRATARLGVPVSRTFEPGRHREVVVVLDLRTSERIDRTFDVDDEAVEELCVTAASIIRRLLVDGASVGLAATGYAGAIRPFAYTAPDASPGQLGRCLDLLARLRPAPWPPLGRLLTDLLRTLQPGTALVVVGTADPAPYVPALRRVAGAGHPVELIVLGERGPVAAARTRNHGIGARAARLDGPWRTATKLVIA
jgi:uncharacterized protein (DUF58 family)